MKKLIWPLLGLVVMAVLTTIQQVSDDHKVTASEWVMVAVQAVMAINVYLTANLPQYTKMKSYVAAVLVVLQLLVSAIVGGVSITEWVNIAISFVAALGVHFTPQPITTVINGTTVPADGERPGTNPISA